MATRRSSSSSILCRYGVPLGCLVGGLTGGLWLRPSTPTAPATAEPPKAPPPSSSRERPVDLFDAVGDTPLIELKSLSKLTNCKIYGKAEFMNPSGSMKDRTAKYLILDAEKKGLLKPGDTIVEATGGNTGISLALLAAARGYKTLFTMPANTAVEKIEIMKTMGAEVHVQPLVSMFDANHFYNKAKQLTSEMDNAVCPDQFENTANMEAHYRTTGPEIWAQAGGNIDGFVAASGTAGTIAGCSKFLKEKKPEMAAWIIDPAEIAGMALFVNNDRSTSTMKGGFEMVPACQGFTVVEGVAPPRVSSNFRLAVLDKGITATNQEIVDMAYFLLKNDGIFVGPSAALNVIGAVKMARELGPGKTIVTILCDGGDRYRSKLFNPAWLKEKNLQPTISDDNDSLSFVK